jgi:hypothetical protein
MTTLGYIAFALVLLLFFAWSLAEVYKVGYRNGHAKADNWWIGAESEVDQTRQKVWRDEL